VTAIIIGGIVGLGGAIAADRFLNDEEAASVADTQDEPAGDAANDNSSTTDDNGSAQGGVQDTVRADLQASDGGRVVMDVQDPLGPSIVAADQELSINSIRFVPGTDQLTSDSADTVDALGQALADRPQSQIVGVLRTTSETTDADNLNLGQQQVLVLRDRFLAAGADEEQLDLTAVGRTLVTVRAPVDNFVELSTGLDRSPLQEIVADIPTYAIGIDPDSGELRPEAVEPLFRLGQALRDDPDGRSVSLAAYAFTGTNAAANDQLAARAAAIVENYLVETYGIDSGRIDLLVVGDAPYAVPGDVGNHLGLRRVS
jgi:outer membrane protein OmpA-like peptidoglycan-associated protein